MAFTTALARYYADVLNSVTISFRVLPPPYDSPAVPPPPPPPRDGSAPASDARAESSLFDSLQSDERYELTIDQAGVERCRKVFSRVRSGAGGSILSRVLECVARWLSKPCLACGVVSQNVSYLWCPKVP